MNDNTERQLNTIVYVIFIITSLIYLYLTVKENEISNDEYNSLLTLARKLSFVTALYFLVTAIIGLNEDDSPNQLKQVIASLLIVIAAITRLTITNDDIEFR